MAADFDLFISHASEDKESLVRPLVKALTSFGLRVWYDEVSLKVGDSLSRSIDSGLAKSTFGVVVLSKSFLEKPWTEYELRGLVAREMAGGKVILPMWFGITHGQLLEFSPSLADKKALVAGPKLIVELAIDLVAIVRPDILENVQLRVEFLRALARGRSRDVPLRELKQSPYRHATLPRELIGRIRLVRAALLNIRPLSLASWVDGFRRDAHPSREVAVWEAIAAVCLEVGFADPSLKGEQMQAVFNYLLAVSLGDDSADKHLSGKVPDSVIQLLAPPAMLERPLPPLQADISSELLEVSEDDLRILKTDRERFPDLPDHLLAPLAFKK